MKKIIFSSLIVIISFGMVGCISRGTPTLADKDKMNQIRVYKSTKEDVRRILGEPQGVVSQSNGKEIWTYNYVNSELTGKGAAKMALNFIPLSLVGNAVAGADSIINGGDYKAKARSVTFTFNKRGVLINKSSQLSNISY